MNFDAASFWIGFATATVLWWLIQIARPLIKDIREGVSQGVESVKSELSATAEYRYRLDVMRLVQTNHLASSLFSLNEIALEPLLLSPPKPIEPEGEIPPDSITNVIIPFLPDMPELGAVFQADTMTLPEALSGGANLLVVGKPGSGKTFALSRLADKVARKDPDLGEDLAKLIPIMLHAAKLPLPAKDGKLLDVLYNSLWEDVSTIVESQLPEFLKAVFESNLALLIIDGFDELPQESQKPVIEFLSALMEQYPGNRLVVAGSTQDFSIIRSISLFPIPMASWGRERTQTFLDRWKDLWLEHVLSESWARGLPKRIDPFLLNGWLMSNGAMGSSPLVLTLKAWSAYAGDLTDPGESSAIEAYINRMSVGISNAGPAMEQMAVQMAVHESPVIERRTAGSYIATFETVEAEEEIVDEPTGDPIDELAGLPPESGGGGDIDDDFDDFDSLLDGIDFSGFDTDKEDVSEAVEETPAAPPPEPSEPVVAETADAQVAEELQQTSTEKKETRAEKKARQKQEKEEKAQAKEQAKQEAKQKKEEEKRLKAEAKKNKKKKKDEKEPEETAQENIDIVELQQESQQELEEVDEAVDIKVETKKEKKKKKREKKKKKSKRSTTDDVGHRKVRQIVPSLIDAELLAGHQSSTVSFAHPVIGYYLAGKGLASRGGAEQLLDQSNWDGKTLTWEYLAGHTDVGYLVNTVIQQDPNDILRRGLMTVGTWPRHAPATADWRNNVMRSLAGALQQTNLPLSLRIRVLVNLAYSGEKAIGRLFKQLIQAPDPYIRMMGCLGIGITGSEEDITVLTDMVYDTDRFVIRAACLALVSIGTSNAIEVLASTLLNAEEETRRAAAEALSMHKEEGYAIIKEGSTLDDLMVRRAIVFGLGRIHEDWANDALVHMQLEDDEWIVRSAANHIVEERKGINPAVPRPLPPLHEIPWLISFASKKGMGVSPGQQAWDMMAQALQEGSEEHQLAALRIYRQAPREAHAVINDVKNLLLSADDEIREAAYNTLWHVGMAGVDVNKTNAFN